MAGHDLVVIGGSAGAIEALQRLVAKLPSDFQAAVVVIVHMSEQYPSILAKILGRAGPIAAFDVEDGVVIAPARIYVGCPGKHVLVEKGRLRVVRGPHVNGVRPSIDVLFRSAAVAYGPRVVGVIISGTLDDGTAGLKAIKRRGGIAIVQDPQDAMFPGMPTSALQHVNADHVLPLAGIPEVLTKVVGTPAPDATKFPLSEELQIESEIDSAGAAKMDELDRIGKLSVFTCPECHGTLYELRDGDLLRYRCHTGHAYTIDSLENDQKLSIESALYAAIRALEEKASMSRRVADRGRSNNFRSVAEKYDEKARLAEEHADALRKILLQGNGEE